MEVGLGMPAPIERPVLTLHEGTRSREFIEHPTEIARRALMDAADVEDGWVARELRRFAWALPARSALVVRRAP